MLVLIIVFIILLTFRFYIAIAIGLAAVATMWFVTDTPFVVLAQRMVIGIDSFVFLAIPLFIFTGKLMNSSKITDKIFDFARTLFGHFEGGLGQANVISSIIFSGMSGSAVADAGGLGAIEIEAMEKQGFPKNFSASITVASSVIGPVIPPSIPMVLYGALAEVSVGRLFMGGIIPGLLVGLSLMILVHFISKRNKYPKDKRATFTEIWASFREAFFPLLTPAIIVGGIAFGVFTATEAAAFAAMYALALSLFFYKTIKIKDIPGLLLETMITTSIVTFIMAAASSFSYILLLEDISEKLLILLTDITTNKFIMLLLLNIVLLFFGCIMDAGIALILLVPILVPILNMVGIDLIHFGVLITLNLMIGVATPPVGMGLFVVSKIANIQLEGLMKSVLPFLVPPILVLLLITYIPQIVLWLPNLFYGK